MGLCVLHVYGISRFKTTTFVRLRIKYLDKLHKIPRKYVLDNLNKRRSICVNVIFLFFFTFYIHLCLGTSHRFWYNDIIYILPYTNTFRTMFIINIERYSTLIYNVLENECRV